MDAELTTEQQKFLAQCEIDFANRYTESDPDYMKILTQPLPPIVHPWFNHARRNYNWGGNHRHDQGGKDRWRDRHNRRDERRDNRYQPYHRHR